MKSMKKALNANKVLGSLKKRTTGGGGASTPPANNGDQGVSNPVSAAPPVGATAQPGQSPEASAHDSVKAFCESGGNVQGDEILFLPPIVDAAESSPAAATECARVIRKFLDKSYTGRASWQYNALMLVRILTDNPGETFTRNLADPDFVETCRKLLKHARDSRVRQMLMETLDDFEHTKMYDPNLQPLVQMWKAQKEDAIKKNGGQGPLPPSQRRNLNTSANPQYNAHSQNYFARAHQTKRLPDTVELASRLEEARTSAKLLEQVVMNTPAAEMLNNDLIKEFADRCQSASRSIQGYMQCDNPSPDNDTMESLIDTNEQLQTALNQHQRAVLNARKQFGLGTEGQIATPPTNGSDRVLEWTRSQQQLYASGEAPESPDVPVGSGKGKQTADYNENPTGPAGPSRRSEDDGEDPFRDPDEANARHHYEPFNPGFGASAAPVDGPSGAGSKPRKDNASDDDLYDAEERSKEPVYRY